MAWEKQPSHQGKDQASILKRPLVRSRSGRCGSVGLGSGRSRAWSIKKTRSSSRGRSSPWTVTTRCPKHPPESLEHRVRVSQHSVVRLRQAYSVVIPLNDDAVFRFLSEAKGERKCPKARQHPRIASQAYQHGNSANAQSFRAKGRGRRGMRTMYGEKTYRKRSSYMAASWL